MSCNQYGCSIFMNQQNQQTVAEGLITGCFCMIIDGVIIISDWMCLLFYSINRIF